MSKRNLIRCGAILALALAVVPMVMFAGTTPDVRVQSNVRAKVTGSPDAGALTWDLGSAGVKTVEFSNGSGANAINKLFVDTAATGTTYDLDAGTMTDPTGTALTFSRITYIRIVPDTDNVSELDVSGDFILTKLLQANGDTLANITIPVKVDGYFEYVAPDATGVAVTATTGDALTVTPSGVEEFTIIIMGS